MRLHLQHIRHCLTINMTNNSSNEDKRTTFPFLGGGVDCTIWGFIYFDPCDSTSILRRITSSIKDTT